MNKVFLGLILAVCVLGLALVMLNDRLGRKPEPRPQAETSQPEPSLAESAAAARARELAEAAAALAPRMPEAGGAETRMPVAQAEPQPIAEPTPRVEPRPLPGPAPVEKPEPQPIARPEPKPAEPKVAAKPAARPAEQKPATKPEPKPAAEKPGAEEKPKPKAEEKPKPKAEEKPRAQTAGERNIERFVVFVRDKGATIRVGGNAKMGYSSMTLENPSRVVLDVAGDWKFPAAPGIPKNDLVSAVRVGQNGDKTRVVIDLKTKPRRVVLVPFKGGDGVDVRVDQ